MPALDNPTCKYIWMDGEFFPYAEAKVPVLSHSLHYGTALFEGIRAYETHSGTPAIFRAEDHFVRFLHSIKSVGFTTDYSVKDYVEAAMQCVKKNGLKDCYIRPLAYLDDSFRGLGLPPRPKVHSAIAAWNWGKYMGDEGQKHGIRAKVVSYRRQEVSSALEMTKVSGHYLLSMLARQEAALSGMEEAILLDPAGFVAEGPGENIFMVKRRELITPPAENILPGITRDSIFQLAQEAGYTVTEAQITRNQLYTADEAFFVGTAVEVTPIREVDGRAIGDGKPGPVTLKLMDAYFKCLRGHNAEHQNWLTPCT